MCIHVCMVVLMNMILFRATLFFSFGTFCSSLFRPTKTLDVFNFIYFQVQLTVTPKVEGILKIIGVRWKLSGSVVGLYNFDTTVVKKKIAKGRQRTKSSPINDLKFLVIKVCTLPPPTSHLF